LAIIGKWISSFVFRRINYIGFNTMTMNSKRSIIHGIFLLDCVLGRLTHLFHVHSTSASTTSGLVQDIEHQVLPSITPTMTFILTLIFMIVNINSSSIIFTFSFVYIAKSNSTLSSLFKENISWNNYSLCTDIISVWMACSWKSYFNFYYTTQVILTIYES
jgi:hypothetical protein